MTEQSTSVQPVSIVVVGLNFGRHVVEALRRGDGGDSVRMIGLCDLNLSLAENMAGDDLRVYGSLGEVLSDDEVEAVVLLTGPVGRAELIRQVIRAGRDVMTTKPFEADPEAAEAVLREAEGLNRTVHLNSPSATWEEDLLQIRSWEKEYDLGCPVAARAETWVSYRESADGSWYDDPERCPAPPILRLGIYHLNDLVRLFGRVDEVAVTSSRLLTGRPTADNAQLSMRFENGLLANVFCSFCVRDGDHYRNGLTLNYERGTIYRNVGPERNPSSGGAKLRELSLIQNQEEWGPRRIVAQSETEQPDMAYNWPVFAAAVRGEKNAPSYEIDHVIEPLRILQAMKASEKSGRFVTIQRGDEIPD